jgi:hypothetical protein
MQLRNWVYYRTTCNRVWFIFFEILFLFIQNYHIRISEFIIILEEHVFFILKRIYFRKRFPCIHYVLGNMDSEGFVGCLWLRTHITMRQEYESANCNCNRLRTKSIEHKYIDERRKKERIEAKILRDTAKDVSQRGIYSLASSAAHLRDER